MSQFYFLSFVTIWVFELHHNWSLWVSSQFQCFSFITISVFEFHNNWSFWVSLQLEFLSVIPTGVFEFHHNLSLWFFSVFFVWIKLLFYCFFLFVFLWKKYFGEEKKGFWSQLSLQSLPSLLSLLSLPSLPSHILEGR